MSRLQNRRVGLDLTSGNILKTLIVFAAPIVLANMIQLVYSIVDLAVIGQYVGSEGTVGVSVGGEVADMGTLMATAFSFGGQIYIAQLIGSGNKKLLKETVGTLLGWMFLISFIVCIGTYFCYDFLLNLLNCPAEAYTQAKSYLLITITGMPFVCGYNAVCGILRGMGESRKPLQFICVAASLNVVLDVLLVAVFKLEAAGTAIATVVSQIGSFTAAFIYLYKQRETFGFELKLSFFKIRKEPLLVILRLGVPRVVQFICIHGTLMWCSANINSYGLIVSATNSIGNKIQRMITMFTGGLEMAAGSMIGQCLGAGNQKRASKTVWATLACGMIVAFVGSVASVLFPKQLYRIFTNDQAVMDYSVTYMRIQIITYISAAFLGGFGSMVNGSGFASLSFLLGIMDGVVFRVGLSLMFLNVFHLAENSYFLGNALARMAPALVAFVYFTSGKWKTRRLLVEVPAKKQEEE